MGRFCGLWPPVTINMTVVAGSFAHRQVQAHPAVDTALGGQPVSQEFCGELVRPHFPGYPASDDVPLLWLPECRNYCLLAVRRERRRLWSFACIIPVTPSWEAYSGLQ